MKPCSCCNFWAHVHPNVEACEVCAFGPAQDISLEALENEGVLGSLKIYV